MTIKNFTFFSPNSTEFPVGSNNDGKLYMMLTGMDYGTIRRKDWTSPLNTALNVQYTNTSIIAGGRYFELLNETVALKGDSVNYIHANIDLTQTANPVSLSAETANNISLKGPIYVPVQTSTVQTAPGLQLQLTKKNDDLVIVRFLGSVANIKKGQTMSRTWVDEPFRPSVAQSLIGHLVGRDSIFHIDLNPDGSITWWGEDIGRDPLSSRGNASYFIK